MDATRDRLIEAATELLDTGGPAAVTLREVGRRAGVSHNAPYKHFADKEDLLAAIAARELAPRTARRRRPQQAPIEGLRRTMHAYVKWATRHPARFKLTFGTWSHGSDELAAAASTARSSLVATVAAAQQTNQLCPGDPERVAALIQAVAHGAVDLALAGHLSKTGKGHASPEDLIDDLLEQLRPA